MLREGDILYLHSLDRLGRDKQGILDEWNEITKIIKADIVVLDMPLLNTTKYKDSLGTFISDLVLQILSWMAQEERERILQRQREGIDVALQKGVKFGRPKREFTEKFVQAYDKWKSKEITGVEAIRLSEVPKSSFYRMIKEYEGKSED